MIALFLLGIVTAVAAYPVQTIDYPVTPVWRSHEYGFQHQVPQWTYGGFKHEQPHVGYGVWGHSGIVSHNTHPYHYNTNEGYVSQGQEHVYPEIFGYTYGQGQGVGVHGTGVHVTGVYGTGYGLTSENVPYYGVQGVNYGWGVGHHQGQGHYQGQGHHQGQVHHDNTGVFHHQGQNGWFVGGWPVNHHIKY